MLPKWDRHSHFFLNATLAGTHYSQYNFAKR